MKSLRRVSEGEVAFVIAVKPGQKKEGLTIAADGSVTVRINAPAQEGKANVRVVEFLSKVFGRPKRDISVARGDLSRHKEIRIQNASIDELIKLLRVFVEKHGD